VYPVSACAKNNGTTFTGLPEITPRKAEYGASIADKISGQSQKPVLFFYDGFCAEVFQVQECSSRPGHQNKSVIKKAKKEAALADSLL
jgi:hypothetical protein